MKRTIQILLLLFFAIAIFIQWRNIPAAPVTMVSIPIVVPSDENLKYSTDKIPCPELAEEAPHFATFAEWTLPRLVCAWHESCSTRPCPDFEKSQIKSIVDKRTKILELRNKKHTLNVSAMEKTISMLHVLDGPQRQFIFDNRDRAVSENEKPLFKLE